MDAGCSAKSLLVEFSTDEHEPHFSQVLDLTVSETTTVAMENGCCLPSSSESTELHLRYLNENDIEEVKELCTQIFPVSYPDYWFEEVTTGKYVWSMAATHNNRIIGIIVADIKPLDRRNPEDRSVLPKCYPQNTPVCYMLSLGVHKAWRRRGVASLLLDQLLSYLQNVGNMANAVRCLYLHVLVTNEAAIGFYERRHFRRHACLRRYYYFNGQAYDGYTYALYLNGGQPPWTMTDALSLCGAVIVRPCTLLWRIVQNVFRRVAFR